MFYEFGFHITSRSAIDPRSNISVDYYGDFSL